jgi:probable O-glycosylation ligase (exosortase A-associated)
MMFISSLPLIFVSPFNGVLIWYIFSLGNFHTLIWGGPFTNFNYAYVIAILTCVSWVFSRSDKKQLPMTPLVIATVLFAMWMTITSCFALAPDSMVWSKWLETEKILFMCLVGYALTTTRDRLNHLIWAMVLALSAWGVKGAILSFLHGGTMIHGPDQGRNADNNHFAVSLILILPLLLYRWQLAADRRLRWGLMAMTLLVTLAIAFTYSRGGLLGLFATGAVFWLRSRAKLPAALVVLAIGSCIYAFAPNAWFYRMGTIETYQDDASAAARLNIWAASLRIAASHPVMGGGFNVTFWPNAVNPLLVGTTIPKLRLPIANHSSYFEVLSEHGYVGLVFFLVIGIYSWSNCSWLVRHARERPDLAWASLLGRMGQAALVGYWVGGAFASLAYLDEYWGILFMFDAARRIVAREISPPVAALGMRLRASRFGIDASEPAVPVERPNLIKSPS